MKRIFTVLAIVFASLSVMHADDRPVTFSQLPAAAQSFINMNFPDDSISYATVDDDFFRPDYNVVLVSGVKIRFEHNGEMEQIECRNGIPEGMVPVQIKEYVNRHYPDAFFTGFEINRNSYEVSLSNRLELKFTKNYNIIEIDD